MIFLTIEQTSPQNQKFGRTVPDLLIHSIYFLVGIGFLSAFAFFSYLLLGSIPMWFWISILMSFIFIPFLSERAKEKANLFVVIDEPFKMSEFRIGKKYGLKIQGKGVKYQSHSGIDRMILSDLDLKNKIGKGFMFSELNQLEQIRDMTTLQRTIQTLEDTLKEQKVSMQTVGIHVEQKSIEIVDWALKTIYGSIIPNEISESFGVDVDSPQIEINEENEILEGESFDNSEE